MNPQLKQIIPGVGIDNLKFGMTRDQVRQILGQPEDVDNIPDDEDIMIESLESWFYDGLELTLVFDEDYDWKLVSVAISDGHYTLFGDSVVGKDVGEVLDILNKHKVEITDRVDVSDDETEDMEIIESENEGLMIWIMDGKAIEIQIVPEVEEDGSTLIWPE
jgi:hypothetical protein